MFSNAPACHYTCSPLGEVICQLRFPEILTINAYDPVDFQEAIRQDYPHYASRVEAPPPNISGAPGSYQLQNTPGIKNYQFVSADGKWRVNLTSKFISLSTNAYTTWDDFAQHLDKPLVAFIKQYHPSFFERIGLRYVNFVSRKALDLEGVPFSELIAPCYLGILAEEDVRETDSSRCSVDAELAIRGGCRLKLHAGPGLVRRPGMTDTKEVHFVFDQDLFTTGQTPINLITGSLETLHHQANSVFRGAITDKLHRAMGPKY